MGTAFCGIAHHQTAGRKPGTVQTLKISVVFQGSGILHFDSSCLPPRRPRDQARRLLIVKKACLLKRRAFSLSETQTKRIKRTGRHGLWRGGEPALYVRFWSPFWRGSHVFLPGESFWADRFLTYRQTSLLLQNPPPFLNGSRLEGEARHKARTVLDRGTAPICA